MANVSVEKFMMPCLEIPGGYLVVQLALQSRHARHSLTRSCTRNTHWTRALRVCLLKRHGIKERVRSKKHMEKLRYRNLEKKDLFGIWLFLLAGFLFHLSLEGFFVTQKFQDLFICFTKFAQQ